jgi:hypothetical protein
MHFFEQIWRIYAEDRLLYYEISDVVRKPLIRSAILL